MARSGDVGRVVALGKAGAVGKVGAVRGLDQWVGKGGMGGEVGRLETWARLDGDWATTGRAKKQGGLVGEGAKQLAKTEGGTQARPLAFLVEQLEWKRSTEHVVCGK